MFETLTAAPPDAILGLNEAFKFRNPNVSGECGCGESFSV